MKHRIIKPYLSFEQVESCFRDVFKTGIHTSGRYVDKFQQKIGIYTGAKYSHVTTSATTALWLCLRLLNIRINDEVIISDFSFPATANVVEDIGAKPVFADVSIHTFNMLPEELERLITKRTKAVIFVDALGNPSGIEKISTICREHNLPLIEDAACAFGSKINNMPCGSLSDLTCFSFHPRKILCTGEGGAITTNNKDWSNWLNIKLRHGASNKLDVGLNFTDYGYNFRLTELQSIMGISQIEKIEEIIEERNEIRNTYIKELSLLQFEPQAIENNVIYNAQSIVFKTPGNLNRDELVNYLMTKDIESTLGTYSISNTDYYYRTYKRLCPNSKFLYSNTITLPCYKGLDPYIITEAIKRYTIINK